MPSPAAARVLVCALALAALPGPSRAAAPDRPVLVIGASDFRPLPIAVQAFSGEGDASAAAATANAVVRSDLALSGLFNVLDPKGFLADPGEGLSVAAVAWQRWADVGADGLVKAVVRAEGGTLSGELHLYEVQAGREVLSATDHAPTAAARLLGHQMSDDIVRYYTHEPGVFSTRIAAVRKLDDQYQLVVADMDGQNPEVLFTDKDILMTPAWRPDGGEILVTSYRTGRPELWAYRLADHSLRPLSHRGNAMGGVYSPDGKRIAFCLTEGANTDIWVMNADGSGARRLTKDPAIDVSPNWSPDGTKITFTSDRAGTPQIYVMNADGGGVRRITFQGNYNQTPVWSPRGDTIAFTARDERKVFDLFYVSPETGVITRITQDQGRTNEDPSWAPNGRLLVFRTDRSGFGQLVVSDPKGNRQSVILGAAGADLVAPAWGPAR
ncbi:MAG TPA: Tol-Pal system beta propeller repeat protein TolB [Anaeromyxobacter sp.]|nr:Tol-Pal system beta propeller repeat protein TolB [Anaeromyxobacter sp.]